MNKIHSLLANSKMSWVWLVVRVYVGWEWLHAGWTKVNNPAWVGSDAGTAISGFLNGALAKTSGAHPDVSAWYAWFVQHVALPQAFVFSHLVAFGELLVGVALIVGAFTAWAALAGAFMNLNYLLAGTLSVNPQLLVLQVLIIAAGKTASRIGLDKFIARRHK